MFSNVFVFNKYISLMSNFVHDRRYKQKKTAKKYSKIHISLRSFLDSFPNYFLGKNI